MVTRVLFWGTLLYVYLLRVIPTTIKNIQNSAKEGDNVTMECDLEKNETPLIKWVDKSKTYIFKVTEEGNVKNDAHKKASHFWVDLKTYSLTIYNVRPELHGSYSCESKVRDDEFRITYDLAVYGALICTGASKTYMEGDFFDFDCKIAFHGREPVMKMVKFDTPFTVEEDDRIDDNADLHLLHLHFKTTLGPTDDKQTFMCISALDGAEQRCNVTLEVKHPMRHASFEPETNEFVAGQQVLCKADGNPSPEVIITREGDKTEQIVKGHGKVAFNVPESWAGQTAKLICVATNESYSSITINKTIVVAKPKIDQKPSSSIEPKIDQKPKSSNEPKIDQKPSSSNDPKAGKFDSSSEGVMRPEVLILNVIMLALLILLHS